MSFQEAKRRFYREDLKLYSHNKKELDLPVQTIHIFSKYIGMEFGIGKCAMLVMVKGKIAKSVGIDCQMVNLLSHYRKVKIISIFEC